MNRKTTLDAAITISALAGMALSHAYLDNPMERTASLTVLSMVCMVFLLLSVRDRTGNRHPGRSDTGRKGISEIQLLGEDGSVTDTWDIYGKTSIVFGRDGGERQVDVDLKHTDYAGTIDGEHAVMNYSSGCWYIEDLDSENGTRVQKGGEGGKYKVSSREPCRIGKGDIIYLGLAPIKIR